MDISISDKANLDFNKNFIPQSYYNEKVQIDDLLKHINEINLKNPKNKISLEDFIARVYILFNLIGSCNFNK